MKLARMASVGTAVVSTAAYALLSATIPDAATQVGIGYVILLVTALVVWEFVKIR